jgi:hypothetical protein
MSRIMISDLQARDLSLSSDCASYLKDLNATEQNIKGGIWPYVGAFLLGVAIGAAGAASI